MLGPCPRQDVSCQTCDACTSPPTDSAADCRQMLRMQKCAQENRASPLSRSSRPARVAGLYSGFGILAAYSARIPFVSIFRSCAMLVELLGSDALAGLRVH